MMIPPQGHEKRTAAALAMIIGVVLVSLAGQAAAHPEIENQIARLSNRIEGAGGNADADSFLQRGELYRVHEDWERGLADFERALAVDPSLAVVRYCRGRLFLERGEPRRAVSELNEFLEMAPGDPRGLALRARALDVVGARAKADADYAAAVERSDRPAAELILEWAACRLASDPEGGGKESALAALDRGMERLGPLVTLQGRAIELECESGNFDAALERVETTMAANGVTPLWLKRKAEILERANRHEDAVRTYREVLDRLDGLPEHRRNVRAFREMRQELERDLARITNLKKDGAQ